MTDGKDTTDSAIALRQWIERHGSQIDRDAARRFQNYLALLRKWNRRVNLTASTEWAALSVLFEEALWAASFYPAGPQRHLDIGSGAGFPAVPMKILRQSMRLCLLESRGRKAAFLETAGRELGLDGMQVECRRAEDFLAERPEQQWDFVSWKAVKVSGETLRRLLQAGTPATQYWLFHGAALPFAEPEHAQENLRLLRREHFPGRAAWHLSIFAPKAPK